MNNSNTIPAAPQIRGIKWAVGLTTVPARLDKLLPETLWSLAASGFPQLRLFVDGTNNNSLVNHFGQDYTLHWPVVGAYGNWVLGLQELYFRNKTADRFAMFQDDITCSLNLRQYLERWYPEKGYLNLYTFQSNQLLAPAGGGWYQSRTLEADQGNIYHGLPQQTGRGACGLIFSREAVQILLSHQHVIDHALDCTHGHRKIDGAVVSAMNKAGWREYVHDPSLLQHHGQQSTLGNQPHRKASSFRGEKFDLLSLPHNSQ